MECIELYRVDRSKQNKVCGENSSTNQPAKQQIWWHNASSRLSQIVRERISSTPLIAQILI